MKNLNKVPLVYCWKIWPTAWKLLEGDRLHFLFILFAYFFIAIIGIILIAGATGLARLMGLDSDSLGKWLVKGGVQIIVTVVNVCQTVGLYQLIASYFSDRKMEFDRLFEGFALPSIIHMLPWTIFSWLSALASVALSDMYEDKTLSAPIYFASAAVAILVGILFEFVLPLMAIKKCQFLSALRLSASGVVKNIPFILASIVVLTAGMIVTVGMGTVIVVYLFTVGNFLVYHHIFEEDHLRINSAD